MEIFLIVFVLSVLFVFTTSCVLSDVPSNPVQPLETSTATNQQSVLTKAMLQSKLWHYGSITEYQGGEKYIENIALYFDMNNCWKGTTVETLIHDHFINVNEENNVYTYEIASNKVFLSSKKGIEMILEYKNSSLFTIMNDSLYYFN
jgi:hypothetical protein